MKIFLSFLILLNFNLYAVPCDILEELTNSSELSFKYDGGRMNFKLEKFKKRTNYYVKFNILSAKSDMDFLLKGDYLFKNAYNKRTDTSFCYLKFRLDGEVVNNMAIFKDDNKIKLFIGVGIYSDIIDSIELDEYFHITKE